MTLRIAGLLVALGLLLEIPATLDTTPPTFLLLGLGGVPLLAVGALLAVREVWRRGPREPAPSAPERAPGTGSNGTIRP